MEWRTGRRRRLSLATVRLFIELHSTVFLTLLFISAVFSNDSVNDNQIALTLLNSVDNSSAENDTSYLLLEESAAVLLSANFTGTENETLEEELAANTSTPLTTEWQAESTTIAVSTTTTAVPTKGNKNAEQFTSLNSLEGATYVQLREYHKRLKSLLGEVEAAMNDRERMKAKRFIPISASLPNRQSNYFLERMGSFRFSPSDDQRAVPLTTTTTSTQATTTTTTTSEGRKQNTTKSESLDIQHDIPRVSFNPVKNHTVDECKRLTQDELVRELKTRGTYNPDLMAYDISGVLRFLDRSIVDQYERQAKSKKSNKQAVWRNVEALERILAELNLNCDVRSQDVVSKITNLTVSEPRRSVMSPSIRMTEDELRYKRHIMADDLLNSFNTSKRNDDYFGKKKQKMIGDVHIVPFGCDKRGEVEDGYLRLCGACQAIRKLPDSFFPPFINEVMCDVDKACLYFYSYAHGKCKQKHMNFVVLRNIGTAKCQVWEKFNLNVRVSCECFVDEMSFFAKYV